MTEIMEGNLRFRFQADCNASKYDDWSFYRNQFQNFANGSKAIDILCVKQNVSWLIEIKDYSQHSRTKSKEIADEVAEKVRDTLAGLASVAKNANDCHERRLARQALANRKWRVVLHLEQPATPSKLRPKLVNTADLLQKLKSKKLRAVDAHPKIFSRSTCPGSIPWTVQ